jgi:putative serine protease PepD
MGSAPTRPPAAGYGGAPNYLPPVPPPGAAPNPGSPQPATYIAPNLRPDPGPTAPPKIQPPTPAPEPNRGGRWGWRALVAFVAGGLIAALGFGAAQLNRTTTEVVATPTLPTSTTAAPATTPSDLAPNRNSGTVPLVPPDVDEPAAFVAVTLGPAVVQIDTDFGVGSGVIYDDGLILTNNHVIEGAADNEVNIQLSNGRVLPGIVVGADPGTDIAVVSVGEGNELPVAVLATGETAQVGQFAIAIGSPFDLQQSVTAGIVSAVGRPIANGQTVVAMIQTDAPINPGNSGGALADRLGRVIGINTSIQTDGLTATNVGVGFAVPIDTAVRIADLLVAGQPIRPGFLGVRGQAPPTGEPGVEITVVTESSAAEGAGLLVGDRVLSIDGAPVTSLEELAGLVLANQAGDVVVLEIVRGGEALDVQVILGERTD